MILLFILLFIALFSFAYSQRKPYSNYKINKTSRLADYSLVFSCIVLISIEAYLEFEYRTFTNNYGITIFLTSSLLLFWAYFFDNIAVLSISLTGLTSLVAIAINPSDLLEPLSNDTNVTNASIIFGVCLLLISSILDKRNIKKHFTFTHYNFAAMMLLIYSLSGVIAGQYQFLYVILLVGFSAFFIFYAFKIKSFYFYWTAIAFISIGVSFPFFPYSNFKVFLESDLIALYGIIFLFFLSLSIYFYKRYFQN